jgi:UDP-N-acetylmuramyl tripeptide synthase
MLAAGRRIAVVSGTNGTTTTTRMLATALEATGPVLSNRDGSNLARGVLTSLMSDPQLLVPTCALEVDELALEPVARDAAPDLYVLCNLSRDQLDRMTEVRVVIRRWQEVLLRAAVQATREGRPLPVVVANADDPMVACTVLPGPGQEPTLPVVWVSVGQPWRADAATCPRCSRVWEPCADYRCTGCGFARPVPTWQLVGDVVRGPDGHDRQLDLALPGRANLANAVMAIAAAAQFGVDVDSSLEAIRPLSSIGGRYASVRVGDARVRLLLAKNPAGWQELLDEELDPASDRKSAIVLSLNARSADGGDTSWIWDVPFERLRDRRVYVAGERAEDLAVRLRYAGVDYVQVRDPVEAVRSIATVAPGQPVDLLANYTAFTAVCRRFGVV